MNYLLSPLEVQLLVDNGWRFSSNEYIYIPDDYDGCMSYGIRNILKVLDRVKTKERVNRKNEKSESVNQKGDENVKP